MKTNLILLFFVSVSVNSCIYDEGDSGVVNSEFQGEWTGTFNGDENGSVTFVVKKEGSITGEITSKEPISGYVNFGGKFDMNTKSNLTFSGYFTGSKSNGKWTKNTLKGDYSFQKK